MQAECKEMWRCISSLRGLRELQLYVYMNLTGPRFSEQKYTNLMPVQELDFSQLIRFEFHMPLHSSLVAADPDCAACCVRDTENTKIIGRLTSYCEPSLYRTSREPGH